VSASSPGEPEPEPVVAPAATAGQAASQSSGGNRVLPEQSREDTDAGWGEYPVTDDERLYRDRPPHWDDI